MKQNRGRKANSSKERKEEKVFKRGRVTKALVPLQLWMLHYHQDHSLPLKMPGRREIFVIL